MILLHHGHARLIDRLGGPVAVKKALKLKETRQAVSLWRKRGIPHKHRPAMAALAKAERARLPARFFAA